jgi:predicted nucleic acid-binding protein
MILLDTNVISELMRPSSSPVVTRWVDAQMAEALFLSSISLSELLTGIEVLPEGRRKYSLMRLLDDTAESVFPGRILPFDEPAARAYAVLIAVARRKGQAISIPDGQIAAIAKARGLSVATRDTSPFLAAGIAVINPWS